MQKTLTVPPDRIDNYCCICRRITTWKWDCSTPASTWLKIDRVIRAVFIILITLLSLATLLLIIQPIGIICMNINIIGWMIDSWWPSLPHLLSQGNKGGDDVVLFAAWFMGTPITIVVLGICLIHSYDQKVFWKSPADLTKRNLYVCSNTHIPCPDHKSYWVDCHECDGGPTGYRVTCETCHEEGMIEAP